MKATSKTPTQRTYNGLQEAFNLYNETLFDGILPECMITMQRKNGAYGYAASSRFIPNEERQEGDDLVTVDEIAMNPSHFKGRSAEQVLSTLAHEMCHVWQFRFGKPSAGGYHNKQWAARMVEIGLMPSTTGEPGGKQTGPKVSHYIMDNGPFAQETAKLIASGFTVPYVELWNEQMLAKRKRAARSKTKYTCPDCGANAWAKPEAKLMCGECESHMTSEETDD